MTDLVIASNNTGKIREIQAMLGDLSHETSDLNEFRLLTLNDIGFTDVIPEPHHTFEENALEKAKTVYSFSDKNVFADDSGLCVHALNGEPGVQSAYYAGYPTKNEANNEKLLNELRDITDRRAYYKAVICLMIDGQSWFFEGICEGQISSELRGDKGFGYDPLFIPDGYTLTFGELDPVIKNQISHRGKAMRKMVEFLKTLHQPE